MNTAKTAQIKQNLAMVIRLASASAEANAAHYRALEDAADEAPADVAELLRAAMRRVNNLAEVHGWA